MSFFPTPVFVEWDFLSDCVISWALPTFIYLLCSRLKCGSVAQLADIVLARLISTANKPLNA